MSPGGRIKSAEPIIKAVVTKGIQAYDTPQPGHVYAKLPFKYKCQAGRAYIWCACGWSKSQPFCDGSHKDRRWKINIKPVRFECHETKEYWFCQCKHTKTRPFCDGTHNTDVVEKAQASIEHSLYPPKVEES